MSRLRKMPLQRKILITYIVFVLLSMTLFFLLLLRVTVRDETSRDRQLLMQINETVNGRLDTVVTDLKNTSAMYIATQEVIGYVKNDFYTGTPAYVETLRAMKANVLLVKVNPYTSSMAYVSNSGVWYSGAGDAPEYYAAAENIIKTMRDSGTKNLLTPVYDTVINRQRTRTITYVYSLQDSFTFLPVGYALINIDMKKLDQCFKVFTSESSAGIMAVQDGRVVYPADHLSGDQGQPLARECQDRLEELKQNGPQAFEVKTGEGKLLCAARYCPALDVVLLSHIPLANIYARTGSGVQYYLATIIAMLCAFVIVSFLLSVWMTKPVRILQAGMLELEHGNLSLITEQTDRQDDMGMLIAGFNRMVTQLRDSLLREYESKDLQRKAQIKMLQSQINPHFLYNALNVIASIAEIEDLPQVSRIAGNLGDMFRYNISPRSVVTLEEELTQLRRYASIQQMCMAGSIQMVYQVNERTARLPILKFLLQPLVENCFEHGFANGGSGTITIEGHEEGEDLVITLQDTGRGIAPDQLAALQRRCNDPLVPYKEDEGESIGLINVNARVKSYYGEDCGILIDSRLGRGTRIRLRVRPKRGGEGA